MHDQHTHALAPCYKTPSRFFSSDSLSLSLFLHIHVIIHTLLNSYFKVFLFLVCYSQKKSEGLDSGPFLLSFYRFLPSSPSSLNARSVRLFERLSKDLIFSFLSPPTRTVCVLLVVSPPSFLSVCVGETRRERR